MLEQEEFNVSDLSTDQATHAVLLPGETSAEVANLAPSRRCISPVPFWSLALGQSLLASCRRTQHGYSAWHQRWSNMSGPSARSAGHPRVDGIDNLQLSGRHSACRIHPLVQGLCA